jgi:hypothetical protein
MDEENVVSADDLMAHLSEIEMGEDPETVVENAIVIYQQAMAEADRYQLLANSAKSLIATVMQETGVTAYNTRAGKAAVTSPSVSVSYDAKAIYILLHDDADLAMRIGPYRKVSERAGSLRITAAK